ncbi:MAG: hypothetical protein ACTS6G_02405 [Candidatus Hodgkinia cicadicola]
MLKLVLELTSLPSAERSFKLFKTSKLGRKCQFGPTNDWTKVGGIKL